MKGKLNEPVKSNLSTITKRLIIIFITFTLFFTISSLVLSQSSPWPMFRQNPQRTGRSPYKGAEIDIFKWRLEVKDLTISSPAIGSDGTIYIGGTHFYAVNPDGTLKWIHETEGLVQSSPAIGADGTIYVGSRDGYFYAINPDGNLKWKLGIGGAIVSSPAIGSDGTIYIGGTHFYAVNPDGTLKWIFKTEGPVQSSPAIGLDGTIYVGSLDENFYAINPDGTLKSAGWIGGQVVSSPAIGSDGAIYMGSENRNLYAIRSLYALRNGKVSWGFDTGSKVVSSPAIGYDGIIYIGGNGLYAVNPSDGTLKWEFKTEDAIESSPAIGSDGTIYVGSGSSLYAVNPDGTIKKRFSTGEKGWFILSSPAIGSDGTIYVGSSNIDVHSIWSIPGTSDVKVGNGFLYAIGNAVFSPQDTETTSPLQDSLNEMLTWDRTYGGSGYDRAWTLIQTIDGGYAVAGFTSSKGAGGEDFWVIKLDEQGNKVWDRTYGGSGYDIGFSLIQTTDGGYAVAGATTSKGAGNEYFWVIRKLDEQGNQIWDKNYGGSGYDEAYSLIQTTDGGYAVAGVTESKGAGKEDARVIKLDEQGNRVWDKTYGGSGDDGAFSLIQTTDGSYAVAGYTESKGAGNRDAWVIKLDKQGNKVWDRTYGGSAADGVESLIQTTDGGYALAGFTDSKGAGNRDAWVIKLDKQGNKVWDRTYGGSAADVAYSLIQKTDGGYAVAGVTESKGAGEEDTWLIKLDSQGNKVWDKTYGGSGYDETYSLIQTTDGGYAVAGVTESKGAGEEDFWVIKLDKQGNLISEIYDSEKAVEAKDTAENTEINDGNSQVSTETSTTMTQTIPVPSFDSYQWEVGLPGFTKPGDITYFGKKTLGTVQLLKPSNGAISSPGNIPFSWDPVSNATKYQFIIYNFQGEVALDAVKSSTSSIVNLDIDIKKTTTSSVTCTWKVRAGDNSGNWGPWSSTWSLTLKSATIISPDSSTQDSDTTYSLTGNLYCPETRGYPCDSCSTAKGYINHFQGFNVLTTNEDCYVKLIYNNGDYIGNQNDCKVTVKGEKWLGLEDESGTKLVEEINKGNFDFTRANKFIERTMNFPGDNYKYEFANEGKEFRLYLPRNREEAFKAVPWKNITVEIKNKETDRVFIYKFQKGIFPQAYSWSNGVANYGQCVWWTAKRWVEEVDSKTLFPFYPPSPQDVNIIKINSNYQPKRFDILINYIPGGPPEHYGFVEKVEGDKMYISQFNWIKPGEVYNYIIRTWNGNATNLFYPYNPSNEYYFKYYYRK